MTAAEVIDKRFEAIPAFELQTRDQLDWSALQLRRMLTYYRPSCFSQVGLNRPICCLLRGWYRKHSELTLTVVEKWEGWKVTRHPAPLKEPFASRRGCLRCFRRSSFGLVFSHLTAAQAATDLLMHICLHLVSVLRREATSNRIKTQPKFGFRPLHMWCALVR